MDRVTYENGAVRMPEIRFTDGQRYYVVNDSVGDFLLHPTYLKYTLACILIYGLLDRGGLDTNALAGFQTVVLWTTISIVSMLWFLLSLSVLKLLWKRGVIRLIYTPTLILPLFIFTSMTTYMVTTAMVGDPLINAAQWATEILRDLIVLLVMDMIFGNFVAPFHPSLSSVRPGSAAPIADDKTAPLALPHPHRQSEVAALANLGPDAVVTKAARDATTEGGDADQPLNRPPPSGATAPLPDLGRLSVGNVTLPAEKVLRVQSEDHYLRIVTQDKRFMVRGRLAEAVEQLDYALGIQVNRSTWVAFADIAATSEGDKGALALTLTSGDCVKVAQSRRIAFLAAMERHKPQS